MALVGAGARDCIIAARDEASVARSDEGGWPSMRKGKEKSVLQACNKAITRDNEVFGNCSNTSRQAG